MKIGCPTEIKPQDFRVGLTPPPPPRPCCAAMTAGPVRRGPGRGSADQDYVDAGATIGPDAATVFAEAELIIKVKEPQAAERKMLARGQILFTYLHLAPDPDQTRDLLDSGVTAIAYETVTDARGGLPLLAPMSEVAGRLAPQVGAWALQKANGGRGMLMGGVPGVRPANVVVIGGGVVGTAAARGGRHGGQRDGHGPVGAAPVLSGRHLHGPPDHPVRQRRGHGRGDPHGPTW